MRELSACWVMTHCALGHDSLGHGIYSHKSITHWVMNLLGINSMIQWVMPQHAEILQIILHNIQNLN